MFYFSFGNLFLSFLWSVLLRFMLHLCRSWQRCDIMKRKLVVLLWSINIYGIPALIYLYNKAPTVETLIFPFSLAFLALKVFGAPLSGQYLSSNERTRISWHVDLENIMYTYFFSEILMQCDFLSWSRKDTNLHELTIAFEMKWCYFCCWHPPP